MIPSAMFLSSHVFTTRISRCKTVFLFMKSVLKAINLRTESLEM